MNIYQFFLLLCSFCSFNVCLSGQEPVVYFFADQTLCANDTLRLPLQVRDFNKVRGFQSSIRWNPEQLTFLALEELHPEIQNNFLTNTNDVDSGGFGYFWLDNSSGAPLVLADSSVLFILKFTTSNDLEITEAGFGNSPTATESIVDNDGVPVQTGSTQLPGIISNRIMTTANIESVTSTNNGTIDLTTIGQGPFSFLWNTGATSEDIESLSAGDYTVTITDAENCTAVFSYEIETSTSSDILQNQLIITPNPTHDYLRINFMTDQLNSIYQYTFYDLPGNLILHKKNLNTATPQKIDIKDQSPGIYFLEIRSDKNKQIFKIVKI